MCIFACKALPLSVSAVMPWCRTSFLPLILASVPFLAPHSYSCQLGSTGISCWKCKLDHALPLLWGLQRFSLAFGTNISFLTLIRRVPLSLFPSLFQSRYMLPTIVPQLFLSDPRRWAPYCVLGSMPATFSDPPILHRSPFFAPTQHLLVFGGCSRLYVCVFVVGFRACLFSCNTSRESTVLLTSPAFCLAQLLAHSKCLYLAAGWTDRLWPSQCPRRSEKFKWVLPPGILQDARLGFGSRSYTWMSSETSKERCGWAEVMNWSHPHTATPN